MNILSKEAILAVDDLPRETVHVSEWGGDVYVRTMSGTDRDAFEASLIGREGSKEGRMENVRARLVALTLCDESGLRLFEDGEIAALGRKSARALDRVFAVAQRLNGIGTEQADVAKKPEGQPHPTFHLSPGTCAGYAGARAADPHGFGRNHGVDGFLPN